MPLSRRSFVKVLGAAGAGAVAAPLVGARGHEALAAAARAGVAAPEHAAAAGVIKLSSNENPRGPGAAALDAIRAALGEGARYPGAPTAALRRAIAAAHGVSEAHVLLGCGSGELLRMAMDAYTSPTRALVTAAPTFELPASRAEVMGVPVRAVPVDTALRLDLDTMAARASGAGLVFLCNPNNPTGTVHPAPVVEAFVRRVLAASPHATIVVDEAYHHYVDDPAYASALPLALAEPRVVVVRTFSKAYGLAGLRIGYAVARPETVALLGRHQLANDINVLGAAAAQAALADASLVERERALNREARDFTQRWFAGRGYVVTPSQANFVMVDVRRPSRDFQAACRDAGVLVGRPFPPLDRQARVSIGTMDEMRAAVAVFERVLRA